MSIDLDKHNHVVLTYEEADAIAAVLRDSAKHSFSERENGFEILSAIAKHLEKGRNFMVLLKKDTTK